VATSSHLDRAFDGSVRQARGLVGETRCYSEEPRRVSPNVEEVPSAECPIGPGFDANLKAQRGAANRARARGTRYWSPSAEMAIVTGGFRADRKLAFDAMSKGGLIEQMEFEV
jgi:hypothetical protein